MSVQFFYYCIFDQINASLVSIKTFFQKHKNKNDWPQTFEW